MRINYCYNAHMYLYIFSGENHHLILQTICPCKQWKILHEPIKQFTILNATTAAIKCAYNT